MGTEVCKNAEGEDFTVAPRICPVNYRFSVQTGLRRSPDPNLTRTVGASGAGVSIVAKIRDS